MASTRRGFALLLGGVAVAIVKGADEAAYLLAKGGDELAEAGARSGDEAADESSKLDDAANFGKRKVRQHRIRQIISDSTASETFDVPENHYAGFEIDPSHRTELSYDFTSVFGDNVDVLLVPEADFEDFRNDEGSDSVLLGSVYDASSGSTTVTLDPTNKYYLVVDNTVAGLATQPDGEVRVEIEVSVSVL